MRIRQEEEVTDLQVPPSLPPSLHKSNLYVLTVFVQLCKQQFIVVKTSTDASKLLVNRSKSCIYTKLI